MKDLAPGTAHTESTSAAFSDSFDKRLRQVSPAYRAAARPLNAKLDSMPASPGPAESELSTYNSGKFVGLVAGAYGELPGAFHVIIDLLASQLADEHL